MTGDAAIYGISAANGAQIAVEEINAAGGVNGYPIELRYEDDAHDTEKALNAYNVLKDWGMQLSLGSVTTKPGEATTAENYVDRIFALTPSASSLANIKGKDNVFQMCFTDPSQGNKSAEYIGEHNLGTNIAVIWKDDEVSSAGVRETFLKEASRRSLNIVSDTSFRDGNDVDFVVQLSDAHQNNADLVFLPVYYKSAALIFSQASAMGYTPKWFGVDGMDGILTLEGFDTSLVEGVMLLTSFNADSTDEATINFVTTYKDLYGYTPNQFAADAYDCIYAFAQALESSSATPEMGHEELNDLMIQQFTTMTFSGLTGNEITWTKDGEVLKEPKGMCIQSGAYVGMD